MGILSKLSKLRQKTIVDSLIKKGAKIGAGTRFNCNPKKVVGTEPYLVTIGKDCLFAENSRIITHDGGVKVLNSLGYFDGKRLDKIAPVVIGDNVYVGMFAMIMPGVKIGNNVIIGAGAIVTHDAPDNCVLAGVPAKIIKSLDEYHRSGEEKGLYYDLHGKSYKEKRAIYENGRKNG